MGQGRWSSGSGATPSGGDAVYTPTYTVRTGGSLYGWVHTFQGLRHDAVSGLNFTQTRPYSATLGQPTQMDWLGLGPDVNPYRWEENGPTNWTDPSGLCPLLAAPLIYYAIAGGAIATGALSVYLGNQAAAGNLPTRLPFTIPQMSSLLPPAPTPLPPLRELAFPLPNTQPLILSTPLPNPEQFPVRTGPPPKSPLEALFGQNY